MKDQDARLAAIEAKLATLVKLEALKVAVLKQPLKDIAVRLQRAGLTPKEIAVLCDTTPNTISVELSKAKRAAKGKKKS